MIIELPQAARERCLECRVGILQPSRAFYCAWVGGQFLTIPDFPAWSCDVCGRRDYDQGALEDLKALLFNANSRPPIGKPPPRSAELIDPQGALDPSRRG
ncbi:MAG: YgiT-type zinc finger protein [Anaerolineales bacterium]|nr:YgiT-type zinc finger protein [Anaerolineales bacterium]